MNGRPDKIGMWMLTESGWESVAGWLGRAIRTSAEGGGGEGVERGHVRRAHPEPALQPKKEGRPGQAERGRRRPGLVLRGGQPDRPVLGRVQRQGWMMKRGDAMQCGGKVVWSFDDADLSGAEHPAQDGPTELDGTSQARVRQAGWFGRTFWQTTVLGVLPGMAALKRASCLLGSKGSPSGSKGTTPKRDRVCSSIFFVLCTPSSRSLAVPVAAARWASSTDRRARSSTSRSPTSCLANDWTAKSLAACFSLSVRFCRLSKSARARR